MGGTGVIDRFLETFTRIIDSALGCLATKSPSSRRRSPQSISRSPPYSGPWGTDEDNRPLAS
jgi:hypothetical protein